MIQEQSGPAGAAEYPARVPVQAGVPSGPEQELPLPGSLKLGFGIDPGAVRNGRLVAPGSSPTWYWPPVIFDLASGKSAGIPLDYTGDFHHLSWTADNKVVAFAMGFRSSMWRFTPEKL